MKTKSTNTKYLWRVFYLWLSFKGEKLSPLCVLMQWPGNMPYFVPWGGQDEGGQSERSEVALWSFLPPVTSMEFYHECMWKGNERPFASHTYTHVHTFLVIIMSILWVSHCCNIRSTLHFPKMAVTVSPISQGSFRTWAFFHQEIKSMSPPLESGQNYSFDSCVAEVTLWLLRSDHKNGMYCTSILFFWDTISWKLMSKA